MAGQKVKPTMTKDHQHLKLDDLKKEVKLRGLSNKCLNKENKCLNKENKCLNKENKCLNKENIPAQPKIYIPAYPQPEFHVSHLKHDTGETGLRGIRKDGGFKDPENGSKEPKNSLVWWSLSVGDDDIASAEERLLEKEYPDRTKQAEIKSFLGEFATSPAFLPSSRMGSFRFTFPLEEVLTAYREQFCSEGDKRPEPVMKVYKTVLYKQEVMYVVLVHSPANEKLFSESPLLSDDPDSVVTYEGGRFIWRSQAMCNKHELELIRRDEEKQMESEMAADHEFYVWDHVAIALHVGEKVLEFDPDQLRENLSYCDEDKVHIDDKREFLDFQSAEKLFRELLPAPLPKAKALKTASNPAE